MDIGVVGGGANIARVSGEGLIIKDTDSALDLMADVRYQTGCDKIILDKNSITEDFFKLSTGLAGEILQKFVNYRVRLAIVGDFSGYTSKPLKDFIYESNKGQHVNFVSTEEEAIKRLSV
jgi:hypothetical protein